MDYGTFLGYTVQLATNNFVTKGVTVALRAGTNAASVVFDTETLCYAAAWHGWLDLTRTHLTTEKGEIPPRASGSIAFTNRPGPGWSRNGRFVDPRTNGIGPLSRDQARYLGLFRHGSNVVFRYTVGGCEVLDMPGLVDLGGHPFFVRTLRVAPGAEPLIVRLRERICADAQPPGMPCPSVIVLEGANVEPLLMETHLQATIPPRTKPLTVKFLFVDSRNGHSVPFENLELVRAPEIPDPARGGPARWPQILTTRGRRAPDAGPFAVDTVTLPDQNPWRSWLRLTGLDFFSDGRAAVCTWNGDVWIASNLDDGLSAVKWKRFAAGLFDPLGLKILRDEIYVAERSQITRLRDLNGDGEADAFDNVNNDAGVSPSYHAFAMDLQTDRAGNFYYCRAGQRVDPVFPLNGGMVRVSADGSRAELIAHGLRVANGMAVGPRDEIICSDNQGNWMPSSRLNFIVPGAQFHGYVPHAHGLPTNMTPPLCWIPMSWDNSSGAQVFVSGDRWPAALQGRLLHTSYGMGSLFHVLWETNGAVPQGGVWRFPLKFDSGIMRARFNPRDGQLYAAGLRAWQTKGVRDGVLQRVRHTGAALHMPLELRARRGGIEITFSDPLERAAAEDLENWRVEQWNYLWTEKYGSDDYSVREPKRKGHDTVDVRAVKLDADGRRLRLEIPGLAPVMQMKIRYVLKSAKGAPVEGEIANTINVVE
jgi:hypothetical protein